MVGYYDLANWYQTAFSLQQHHNYSLQTIEEWLPYERDIYVAMLIKHLQEEAERHKQK